MTAHWDSLCGCDFFAVDPAVRPIGMPRLHCFESHGGQSIADDDFDVHHRLEIDLSAVEQLDDSGVDVPDFVWPGGADTEGGLGRMDALARTTPAMLTNELCPSCRRGEDLGDSLGIASQGAHRHVPVFGREHHLFDGGNLAAGELARACARTRRSVGQRTRSLCSAPSMVASSFEAKDTQDGGQGKERFGAGDCAKEPGLRLSFWETISGEAETGGTKQSEQETNNGGEDSRLPLPSRAGRERAFVAWSNGSVVTTGRTPRRRQLEAVDRGM